jgi:tRNA (guanine-N7-)-methyltransferase
MHMVKDDSRHRPIRSFVLRQGRMTTAQERAFGRLWPRYGVEWSQGDVLDLVALFGNTNPVYLEIGFGNGETLATLAERHPDRNYLGIEVHRPGVGHLLLEAEKVGVDNLRILREDAVDFLSSGLAPASLSGVYLFFPDPWPKKKHHKRRILSPELTKLLADLIRPGGLFHAATDWEHYALQMLSTLTAADRWFINDSGAGAFSPRPPQRPLTKFERRGQRLGHRVWDLVFHRR